jgi:L-gulonolactone oxidase
LGQRQLFQQQFQNWSRQYRCIPHHIHYPTDTKAVGEILQGAVQRGSRVRVFGAGHSPSDIAMSDEELIVPTQLNHVLGIYPAIKTAVVEAGITLTELNQALACYGLALPNLGSISAQTLAGAMATATHGTGINYGVLPTLIRAMTLVTAQGEVLHLSEQENVRWFKAAQCSLGSLGVVTELELQVCDAFDLEVSEQPNNLETVLNHLPNRLQADHYRFWYLPHSDRVWEWSAMRKPPGCAQPALTPLHRIRQWYKEQLIGYHVMEFLLYLATFRPNWIPAINRWYTQQQFETPRQSCSDSVSQFNFDCLFKQYVNEWCIPIQHTADGILKIREMIYRQGYQVHLPIEVRFVKGDNIWLSPCQGRDSCYIGVIAYLPYGKPMDYTVYFADYERIMESLDGRPHWAKRFGPDHHWLKDRYPHWLDFQAVRTELDPHHYFSNSYTKRVLG